MLERNRLGRTLAIAAIALTTALPCSLPLAHEGGHDEKAAGPKQTLTGELVDMACYLNEGAKGADHQECASMCAKDGIPVGLLTGDGKLYALIVPPSALASVMASQAEVTGSVRGEMIVPDTLKVKKGSEWKAVTLPKHSM
jgi:hypothetical protein